MSVVKRNRWKPRQTDMFGFEVKGLAQKIVQRMEDKGQGNNPKCVFLKHALTCLGEWEVGNFYWDKYFDEEYVIVGMWIDIHRETWSVTVANWREIYEGRSRTHISPWKLDEDTLMPVTLVKSYDKHDMCVICGVVHLVMQNPGDDYECYTSRQEEKAECQLLAFEASMV